MFRKREREGKKDWKARGAQREMDNVAVRTHVAIACELVINPHSRR